MLKKGSKYAHKTSFLYFKYKTLDIGVLKPFEKFADSSPVKIILNVQSVISVYVGIMVSEIPESSAFAC